MARYNPNRSLSEIHHEFHHRVRGKEVDGRWLAEVPQLPGVLCYDQSADDAMAKAEVLALRAMADRLEQKESRPVEISISFPLVA